MFKKRKNKKGNAINERQSSTVSDGIITADPTDSAFVSNQETMDVVAMICRLLLGFKKHLTRLDQEIADAIDQKHQHAKTLEACLDTVADCQRKTADLINQKIERHALYPAVKSVNALASLIFDLTAEADRLVQLEPENPALSTLHRLLNDAARLAHDKQASLDMVAICPAEGDSLDSKRHEIVKAVVTDDTERHGDIESTVTAGFVYRGEVIRPAKVCVYRFMETKHQEENTN